VKKAFTMIEVIFVIVIIGVLAAVAIPKLTSLRDEARATTCVHEVRQFINELTQKYGSTKTFLEWQILKLEDNITNINLNVDTSGNGIHNGNEVAHNNTISYHCDGVKIMDIKPANNALTGRYEITIEVIDTPTSPAALTAANTLEKKYGALTKVFSM